MSELSTRFETVLGTPAASTRGWVSWSLFEWARNPYVLLVTIYIFAPYFSNTVVGDSVKGQSLLGYTNSVSGFMIAILAPFLGAIADKGGRRKPWIVVFVTIMAPCIFLLWFAEPNGGGFGIYSTLAAMICVSICFEFGAVFHNAMLPHVAPRHLIGMASGLAISFGNLAGLVLMAFVLYAFALPGEVSWSFIPAAPLFGLDQVTHEHQRIVAPIASVWLAIFALPLFLFTPDAPSNGLSTIEAVRAGLRDVVQTLKRLKEFKNVALYLFARMIFNDGMVGVLVFGGVYASGTFHWEAIEMLFFGIITSFSAALGAIWGGRLDDRLGSRVAILLSVGLTAALLGVAVLIRPDSILLIPLDHPGEPVWSSPYFNTLPELLYFANIQVFAVFITVAFASARTMLARIAPPSMMTQFFGLFALSGTATSFMAPAMVGFFTDHFSSQRAGFASLIILLTIGFALTFFVQEKRTVTVG